MKKGILFVLTTALFTTLSFAQIQIGADIVGEAEGDQFGYAISISDDGKIMAVSANFNAGIVDVAGTGHVRIFEKQGSDWIQMGPDLDAEAAVDRFGHSVSVSGDGSTVAVGAFRNDGNGSDAGHVRVFENQGGVWIQVGQDIDGLNQDEWSGFTLSINDNGSIVAIGARYNGGFGFGTAPGQVRIYENQGGSWLQIGQGINGEAAGDEIGGSSLGLSADGTIVAIGSPRNSENGVLSGHVRVFKNQAGSWTQIGQDIDGIAASDRLGGGLSLSADGTIVAVTAFGEVANNTNSGQVLVFKNEGDSWSQVGQTIEGETVEDGLGSSLSISDDGSILAISSLRDVSNGIDYGHVQLFENQGDSWVQIGEDIYAAADVDLILNVSLSGDGNSLAVANPLNSNSLGLIRVYDNSQLTLNTIILDTYEVSVGPNPFTDRLFVDLNDIAVLNKVMLYDTAGKLVHTDTNPTISTGDLTPGIYILKAETDKGNFTTRLIKQ